MRKRFLIITHLVIAIVAIAALAITVSNACGIRMLAVLSDCMEPGVRAGSVVLVAPAKPASVKLDDVIVLPHSGDSPVVRRVTEIDNENQRFIVTADSDGKNDPKPVPFESVTGVVRFSVPVMGYPLNYLYTAQGGMVAVITIIALFLTAALLGGRAARKPSSAGRAHKRATYSRGHRYEPKFQLSEEKT